MATAVVLGGGITGLSTAYYLTTFGKHLFKKVCLIETSNNVGGWMRSSRFPDGTIYEHGPRSIRPAGEAGACTLQLIEELGLYDDVLPIKSSHPSAKTRLILVNDQLHPLPASIRALIQPTKPFSRPLGFALVKDIFTRKKVVEDESMYSFAQRRLGKEIADYLIDPLCRGVVAGDSKEISVMAILRPLFEAEQKHGSIVKGMLKNMKGTAVEKMAHDEEHDKPSLTRRAVNERWRMWSLRNGLQTIPDRLRRSLENSSGVTLELSSGCEAMTFENGGRVKVKHSRGEEVADHVFSSLPAGRLSSILPENHSVLANDLSEIEAVSVATACLEFEGNLIKQEAFGFLVPSSQKSDILGVIYDSCNFPEHNGKEKQQKTRVTVMMGGRWFESLFGSQSSADHDQVLRIATAAVKKHLGISDAPIRHEVLVQKNCIPQYVVGHFKRVDKIKQYVRDKALPLTLLGSSYNGVSINDCIFNAKQAVLNLVQQGGK